MPPVVRPRGAGTGETLNVETRQEPSTQAAPGGWRRRLPRRATVYEAAVFLGFAVFFLAYGLTPYLGGDGLGLVGADEPRYAQIAHEMLVRFDSAHTLSDRLSACVTPYLYGHPWLEKPALYYWRAMFVFQEFGVHDWSARLPSASFAFVMAALIYLHMRRFRPGGHLDAALITVACAGIIGFSRGASTDMQMAAPLSIGLLGWYAWYETDSKFWLFDIYFFTGVATLAKGPVAPFLAAVHHRLRLHFCAASGRFCGGRSGGRGSCFISPSCCHGLSRCSIRIRRSSASSSWSTTWSGSPRTAISMSQPFWYYVVVVVLAMMPWTVIAMRALVDGVQTSVAEWRLRQAEQTQRAPNRPGDAFPEFLVLWALIPIVFFSFSQSKLPGYILPSIPPIAILTGDFLFRRRKPGLNRWVLGWPRGVMRGDDHVCLAAAVVCESRAGRCRRPRALVVAAAGGCGGGAADRHRGARLWRGAAAAGDKRRADGADALSLWRGAVLWNSSDRARPSA